MSFKDHFSQQADEYARHRPQYPAALFSYLASLAPTRNLAWDCGTGNGQAAVALAEHFARVIATDASEEQVSLAFPHERVTYLVARAEDGPSGVDGEVDLVTAAIAVHWFELDEFYATVRRVCRPEGVLAVWTYHLPHVTPAVDELVADLYANILNSYWPEQLHYVDTQYRTLPFPFPKVETPDFDMRATWRLDHLLGFIRSWSARRRYLEETGEDPAVFLRPQLEAAWGDPQQSREVRWELTLCAGRVNG